MASDSASDSESDSASASSGYPLHLVSPLVLVEDLKHPDLWMCHENLAKTRESYLSAFCDGLKNMILVTESFVDTCRAIATKSQITNEVSPSTL